MGGAVSAGEDNDELIDNLVGEQYVKTPLIEHVFRAVDRGDYYAVGCKENAYKDLAWKHGNLHLSAPCIYSKVMESLKLESGLSFLNLGSGTGYLSTMVGLILGPYGTNHGVELHEDVVTYATDKLEEFKQSSPALDEFEFSEPQFVVGNCLLLESNVRQYDRVYCGASCPQDHELYMKKLLKVGGILVMPLNDQLLQITRTGVNSWETESILPVSFASLVLPSAEESLNTVKLLESQPLMLQNLCRSTIRIILRKNIDIENPKLKEKKRRNPKKKRSKRRVRRIVIPVFNESDDYSDHGRYTDREDNDSSERLNRTPHQAASHISAVIEQVMNRDTDLLGITNNYSRNMREDENGVDRSEDNGPEHNHESSTRVETTEISSNNGKKLNHHNQLDVSLDAVGKDRNGQSALQISEEEMDTSDDSAGFPDPVSSFSKSNDDQCREPGQSNQLERKRSMDDMTDDHSSDSPTSSQTRRSQTQRNRHKRPTAVIWKRVAFNELVSDSDNDESTRKPEDEDIKEEIVVDGSYTTFMKEKINKLPLPGTLKVFLNYNREF